MTRAFIIHVELDDATSPDELTLIADQLGDAVEDAGFIVSASKPWATPGEGDSTLGAAFGALPL